MCVMAVFQFVTSGIKRVEKNPLRVNPLLKKKIKKKVYL